MNHTHTTQLWSAFMFIISGIIFLMEELTQRDLWYKYWPVLIIATGLIILWNTIKINFSNKNKNYIQ